MTDGERLALYGSFKQASFGPCTTEQPPYHNVRARAKWNSWKQLGEMRREDAETHYVQVLMRLRKLWLLENPTPASRATIQDLDYLDSIRGK
jgi:acyl-CoA-binding protein